ncbi:MAG: LysE family translocator [Hydrotalea sp.]|nr:LysE family translocator [Hydrotalea sp.]
MLGIDINIWLSLLLYMAVTSITPGPNNLMLMASGSNFGFYRSLPHLLGVTFGFTFLLLATGFGLAQVFSTYPVLYLVLKYAGAVYLLYLSYRLAISKGDKTKQNKRSAKPAKPFGFFAAVAFQWVNPKGVVMAISFFAIYLPVDYSWQVVLAVCAIDVVMSFLHAGLWVVMGTSLAHLLKHGNRQHYFNIAMALLLVLSLIPAFIEK